MDKEEFILNYKNNNCKIKYNASCGHENNVSYKNFNTLNQGINCPKCVNKNAGIKLKELYSNDNKLSSLKQELKCINYIKELIGDYFITIKSFDGCKADIVIKRCEEIEDLWLGIQVKTTNQKTDKNQYYFRLNNGKYDDCLLLCMNTPGSMKLDFDNIKYSWDSFMMLVSIHPGDNDTTAAIGGAWYGALLGFEGIDEERMKELEFYKELDKISNKI